MPPTDAKYEFDPYDCTPGEGWEAFNERFMDYASDHVDDRGCFVADHILDVDEGGAAAGAPAFPVQPA